MNTDIYFHTPVPFSIGDECLVKFDPKYRKGIIKSECYIAPSGIQHMNVEIKGQLYAIPTFDLYIPGTIDIINEAFIVYKAHPCSHRNFDYSRSGTYQLRFDDTVILECYCSCRKEANTRLLSHPVLEENNIHYVYSNGKIIYKNKQVSMLFVNCIFIWILRESQIRL